MSETSNGPGWWLASDGKWYDPRLAPPGYVHPDLGDGTLTAADGCNVQTGSFTSRGRLGASFGWLGMIVAGFVYLMVAALFILLVGVVVGGFLLALLIAVTALGIHRLMLMTSGRYQARRAVQWEFQPITEVIDVADTARSDGTAPRL